VNRIFGLEICQANVQIAQKNALLNGVEGKVSFLPSDSYSPFSEPDRKLLDSLAGQMYFILANPPASEEDDGFGYRMIVLKGARRYLTNGGVVFLNISLQYGTERVRRLTSEIPEFSHGGNLSSTDWVSFDLKRPDLLRRLEQYVQEEQRGGIEYTFAHPKTPDDRNFDAQSALAHFR
jgi:hypothetical protein